MIRVSQKKKKECHAYVTSVPSLKSGKYKDMFDRSEVNATATPLL